MHRAFSRAIRKTCRKWRENEVPAVGGEEVRKNQDSKGKFVPPSGHTLSEGICWAGAGGLYLSYTHRRRSVFSHGCTSTDTNNTTLFNGGCPFNNVIAQATKAVGQLSSYSTVACINSSKCQPKAVVLKRGSIDTSPFLEEDLLFSEDETELESRNQSVVFEEDEVNFIDFGTDKSKPNEEPNLLASSSAPPLRIKETWKSLGNLQVAGNKYASDVTEQAKAAAGKFSGDLFSVLGSLQYLGGKKSKPTTDPPMTAIELLQKGASLGSCRAYYNMGVYYEREKNEVLAKEYYKKASDLGHPCASYNYALFKLDEGSNAEGLALMQFAAKNQVEEAINFMKDLKNGKKTLNVL